MRDRARPGNDAMPDPPPAWGVGKQVHLLVGALAHSSRWRGVLAASEDQPI
jgi:hypothetical protein